MNVQIKHLNCLISFQLYKLIIFVSMFQYIYATKIELLNIKIKNTKFNIYCISIISKSIDIKSARCSFATVARFLSSTEIRYSVTFFTNEKIGFS